MIKEAITHLQAMTGINQDPVEKIIGASTYTTNTHLKLIESPKVRPVEVHFLDGLLALLKSDAFLGYSILLCVDSPTKVTAYEASLENDGSRNVLINCTSLVQQWKIPHEMSVDEFHMFMLTKYDNAGHRDELIRTMSKVSVEHGASATDDGISTSVTVKKGAARFENKTIENPVMLSPLRSFPEINVDPHAHVFRVDTSRGIAVKLQEVDGGIWENQAAKAIRAYLAEKLGDNSRVTVA